MAERGSESWTHSFNVDAQPHCSTASPLCQMKMLGYLPIIDVSVRREDACGGPGLGRRSSGSYTDFTVLPYRLHQPRLGNLLSLTKPPFSPLEHGRDNSKCVPTVNLTLD